MQIFQRVWNNINSLRTLVVGLIVICFTVILLAVGSNLDAQRVKQAAVEQINATARYTDSELGVAFSYPRTWSINTISKMKTSSEFAVEVSDGNTQLQFLQYFGELKPTYRLAKVSEKYTRVGEGLVRYPSVDFGTWYYVASVDCTQVGLEKEAESDICVGDFYPGFVKDKYSRLKATGRLNNDIWPTLDSIAISGMN